jgi:response regulator RpfG family c-di-GMP phosphodiesterase
MFTSDSTQKELFDTIWRLAYMAEYREGNVQSHFDRIRGYTFVLARGLGLHQKEVQIISIASQLHDIGKIGLAESLRLKQGDYSTAEMDEIKKHTLIGSEILKDSPSVYLQAGECIALNHHERWDGSGYPNGLRRDAIPLSARITAIADVFDALTTPRPYKHEISIEDARQLISDASGLLFDPNLVQVFNDDFGEIQRIRRGKK